ncbi:MAG: hydroxysqualene dehydroxylase HpnE [Sphingomonadales bacterium]
MARVHIIGAGMAGLTAAVKLAGAGLEVHLYESSGQAGGRARSFHDEALDCLIDNGNHLLLTGNYSVRNYLKIIGAEETFAISDEAVFPFLDLATGERWRVRPGKGRLPLWLFNKNRSIPGVKAAEFWSVRKIYFAGKTKTVEDCTQYGPLFDRFWEPMTLAALNTPADVASAYLLKAVLKETFFKGATYCRPMIAKDGLSESLVIPALDFIRAKGGTVHFNHRLTGKNFQDAEVKELIFGKKKIELGNDQVILAVPPAIAAEMLPGLLVPTEFHAIVNAHFKLKKKQSDDIIFLGLLGGVAHWLFLRGDIASVTVSAADRLAEKSSTDIAKLLWADVARALALDPKKIPRHSIIKEKRATFSQTPTSLYTRPRTKGQSGRLYLAGDWINTGIPATIESAVRSGFMAAKAVLKAL